MSEIPVSPSEKDVDMAAATTPPFSSHGPTLPSEGATGGQDAALSTPNDMEDSEPPLVENREKADGQTNPSVRPKVTKPLSSSMDPALYHPWTLLPQTMLNVLESQRRLRQSHNILPVVFSKNQNIKSGINRLKWYFTSHTDPAPSTGLPDALKHNDSVIAVSAQGQATIKLVSIVDMAKRFVAPSRDKQTAEEQGERWWSYTMLTYVETAWRSPSRSHEASHERIASETARQVQASDGSPIHANEQESSAERAKARRRVPVLTVWATRQSIPAFKDAFGESSFTALGPQARRT